MSRTQKLLARLALSFLWIWTGISSIFLAPDIGYQVLASGGIVGGLADIALWSGGVIDIALGVWVLANRYSFHCCVVQLLVVFVYSVLLSIIDPSFWVHPFGPLSKNIPIMMLIYLLYQAENQHVD